MSESLFLFSSLTLCLWALFALCGVSGTQAGQLWWGLSAVDLGGVVAMLAKFARACVLCWIPVCRGDWGLQAGVTVGANLGSVCIDD